MAIAICSPLELLRLAHSAMSIQNAKRVEHYQKSIDSGAIPFIKGIELTSESLRQFVINQLICHFNLNFAAVIVHFAWMRALILLKIIAIKTND